VSIFLDDRSAPRSTPAAARCKRRRNRPVSGLSGAGWPPALRHDQFPVARDAWPSRPTAVSRRGGGVPGGAFGLSECVLRG